MAGRKATDDELVQAFSATGTLAGAGEALGVHYTNVARHLVRLGVISQSPPATRPSDEDVAAAFLLSHSHSDLARRLGIAVSTAARRVRKLGLRGEFGEYPQPRPAPAGRKKTSRSGRFGPDFDFDARLASQGGVCRVCLKPAQSLSDGRSGWAVDHDHNCCPGKVTCGRCVRGILCRSCNIGLGMFGDSPASLARAALYARGTPW